MENISLYARFECSTEPGLRIGETIQAAEVVQDTQSEENPEGRWIPGVKERATAISSTPKNVTLTEVRATKFR